jgi:hypothetical protein
MFEVNGNKKGKKGKKGKKLFFVVFALFVFFASSTGFQRRPLNVFLVRCSQSEKQIYCRLNRFAVAMPQEEILQARPLRRHL